MINTYRSRLTERRRTHPHSAQRRDRQYHAQRQHQNRLIHLHARERRYGDPYYDRSEGPVDDQQRHDERLREARAAEEHARRAPGGAVVRLRRDVEQLLRGEVVCGVDEVQAEDGEARVCGGGDGGEGCVQLVCVKRVGELLVEAVPRV